MTKYTVNYDTQIAGKNYKKGEEIELDENEARALLGSNTLAPQDLPKESKEKAKKSQDVP